MAIRVAVAKSAVGLVAGSSETSMTADESGVSVLDVGVQIVARGLAELADGTNVRGRLVWFSYYVVVPLTRDPRTDGCCVWDYYIGSS